VIFHGDRNDISPDNVRLEVLIPVTMKGSIFWDVTPCTLLDIHGCFRRTQRLPIKGQR
jgi:hypothetical protein